MKRIAPTQAYIDVSRAKLLIEKWKPVLDYSSEGVAPIHDDRTRLNTAMVLENQEHWCINESGNVSQNGGVFGAGTSIGTIFNPPGTIDSNDGYAQGDARLPKILIPMIRRTFPELISNEIVGVQPMSGPVGLAFALRYQYEANQLGNNGVDGSGTNANAAMNNPQAVSQGVELGYQYLDTRYTGTSSSQLSGTNGAYGSLFPMVGQDTGVAAILSQFELSGNIPQIQLTLQKTAVEAGTRRLAARWSVELEQDLRNMNGIDVDTELTNAMSYELQAEIDREMIIRMIQVALNAGFGTGYSVWSPASADGRWLAERNRDFYQKLIIEANRIAVRNRRGSANFVVGTPRVCAILEMLPEFTFLQVNGNVNTQPVGIAKVGSVGGRFNIYRDTRTEAQAEQTTTGGPALRAARIEYALLGYKGPEFYDTGIIYCPYIPVMVQRTIGPNDFSPRVGLLTRYGVVDNIFGANLYYHVVLISGIDQAFTPGTQSVYF